MKYHVILSDRAEYQLESAYEWWATHRSLEQAINWYNGFLDSLKSLRDNPQRCSLALENSLVAYELRQIVFGSGRHPTHRAIFTIRPDMVFVLAIRHFAQGTMEVDDL
jgi:plasmid stabilization system protein ParE